MPVQCSADTFVVNQKLVLRINICGENRHLRQASIRYGQLKQTTMTEWKAISLSELYDQIEKTETDLNGELWNFWQLIKTDPTKWTEKDYGVEGGGFWVVAICGTKVIWYNDIEDGFNISDYKTYGQIEGYYCNNDELSWAVSRLFDLVKFGGEVIGQAGPPQNLT